MHTLFRIKKYISYWLDEVDEHSLHSPFYYDFFTRIVNGRNGIDNSVFEQLRLKLQADTRTIDIVDFGNGSAMFTGNKRKVSDIAKTSLSPRKYSELYSRVVTHYKAKTIVDLGTSLGINTLYLAGNTGSFVTTFEGSTAVAEIAQLTFEFAGATNIKLNLGNIDTTLPAYLSRLSGKIDLAFVDANHRYAATIKYFELLMQKTHHESVIIFDDVYYSPEMAKAWSEIKSHPMVYGSVDFYRCGLVFFDPSLNKQHVVMQY